MNNESLLKQFVRSYVYAPFLGTAFVFGLMLLFYRDLHPTIQTILLPAIAVYMIGTLLLGYVYSELDRINCVRAAKNNEKPAPQPWYVTGIIWALHGIWFLLLVIYLFRKTVL
ncbi:MAG TPA: hypothetical protein VMX13_15385 [Sedimentisphaerales bacterium]|nr:hypothetical protein [Sedimentisphaerales bacterium]